MFRALRAFLTAASHGPKAFSFLALRLAFLLTILPILFFTRSVFVSPVLVLLILPAKAWRLASLAEITFFFMALMALGAAAFMARMAFIALAIVEKGSKGLDSCPC